MSGICGIYCPGDPTRATRDDLDRMMAAIGHRGSAAHHALRSDAAGLALGHVFDGAFEGPCGARSPLWHEDGDDAAALDGFLLDAAPANGRPGDAAALVGLVRSGPDAFPDGLDGHFGLAAWRGDTRELWLARDRLGAKPLYYLHLLDPGLLVFASELKGVLAHPAARRALCPEALSVYLTYGYIPAPLSIYRDVFKVFPGEVLRVDGSGRLTARPYGRLPGFAGPAASRETLDDYAAPMRDRLIRTVEAHVRGPGPRGVLFSGGVDSTIILAILRTLGVSDLHTFTIGFRMNGSTRLCADLGWAERVAVRFGTTHHPVVIGPDHDPGPRLPRVVRQFDEPILTPNAYSKHILCDAAARAGVIACVSGSHGEYIADRIAEKKIRKMWKAVGEEGTVDDVLLHYRTKFFSFDAQRELLVDPVPDPRAVAHRVHDRYRRDVEAEDIADVLYGVSVRLQGSEKSITVQDRASSLSGVSVRHPFFDGRLLAWANGVPARLKGREHKTMRKAVLKAAFERLIPEDVLHRSKVGYPSYYWTGGELAYLHEKLLSPEAIERLGIFRPDAVRRVLEADRASDDRSRGKLTWGLLMTQAWCAVHLHGAAAELERDPAPVANGSRRP